MNTNEYDHSTDAISELAHLGQGELFEQNTNPELAFVQQHHAGYFQSTLPDEDFSGILVYEGGVPTQQYDNREIGPSASCKTCYNQRGKRAKCIESGSRGE